LALEPQVEMREGPLVYMTLLFIEVSKPNSHNIKGHREMFPVQMEKCHMQILGVTRDIQIHKE